MGMDDCEAAEVNKTLMREQILNRNHDPEITAAVDTDWKARGVDVLVAKSIEFMHYVRKSVYCHVKSGTLVTRLRAERDSARI